MASIYNYFKSFFSPTITFSKEDVLKTIEKLHLIKKNIEKRIKNIDLACAQFLKKATHCYEHKNTTSAIYNLRLKKMYEQERNKWESICFNIDTQIFTIDSMTVIIDTVDTLKDTSQYIKNHIDLSSIDDIIENFNTNKEVSLDLHNIFTESTSDFDEKSLLTELQMNSIPKAPQTALTTSTYNVIEKKVQQLNEEV